MKEMMKNIADMGGHFQEQDNVASVYFTTVP